MSKFPQVLLSPEDEHRRNSITTIASNGYPRCGKRYLHHLVQGWHPTLEIDHINRNKLDCRRENLRHVTKSVNGHNAGPQRNNASGVRGVCLQNRTGYWLVQAGNSPRTTLYQGPDFFEACCARKSYEVHHHV